MTHKNQNFHFNFTNFSFGSKHTKQLGREGMNKLANKAMSKATTVVASIAGCRALRLFTLLMLVLALSFTAQAFAQAVNPGATPAQTVPDPNDCSAEDICKTYDKRFPFEAEQRRSDTHTRKAPGTNNEESDEGENNEVEAYKFVLKRCDLCQYGIAYMQIPMTANNRTLQSRDNEVFKNTLKTNGLPLSDTQFQVIQRENHQRFLEQLYDPEKMMWAAQATAQMQGAAAANSTAGTAEQSFGTALDRIVNADSGNCLINVANEASGAGYPGRVVEKTIPEAVGMVQTMYRRVFIPMAILFLLPGAVASQVKGQIGRGFNLGYAEGANPFEGILRSIVAIFLIPSTQVIVSWSIDTGNSMALSVRDWVDTGMIQDWARQLSYNTRAERDQNVLNKGSLISASTAQASTAGSGSGGGGLGSLISSLGSAIGGTIGGWISSLGAFVTASGGDGLGAQQPEQAAISERVGNLSQIMQLSLNTMMNMASIFLVILGAYQIVMICYLFLLGPLAAAFYAWPQVGKGKLFRGVFGAWVEGVIQVSLWRFYWMVVLAVMTQRLIYTNGGTSDLQWEVCMFTCFLGILLWAPASPFSFSPNGGLASTEKIASANKDSGKGGGGGGKGPGGEGEKGAAGAPGADGDKQDDKSGAATEQKVQPEGQGQQQENQTQTPAQRTAEDGTNKKEPTEIQAAPPTEGQKSTEQQGNPTVNTAPPPNANSGEPSGGKEKSQSQAPVVQASAEVNAGNMQPGQAPVPLSGSGGAKTSTNPGVAGNQTAPTGGEGAKKAGGGGGKTGAGNTTVNVQGGNTSAGATASASAAQKVTGAADQIPKEKKKNE